MRKQDAIICERFRQWLDAHGGSATAFSAVEEMRPFVRDLNAWTSQEVFAGERRGQGAAAPAWAPPRASRGPGHGQLSSGHPAR